MSKDWCCSLVWEKANEKNLFPTSGRTAGSLPRIWMDPGKSSFCITSLFFSYLRFEIAEDVTNVGFQFYCQLWQTNNILAPIITHGIYSTVILGHGLVKIHDHKRKLRQRIRQLNLEERQKFKWTLKWRLVG